MKKLVFTIISAFALASCGHDNFETVSYQQVKQESFVADFNKTFGVAPEVYKNHQWGMNTVPLIERSATRGAYTNGNQWEGQGYTIPADINQAEIDAVLNVFNKKGEAIYTSLVDWDEYFVQQVYKGDASYYNHEQYIDNDVSKGLKPNQKPNVVGSQHMDWICTVTNKHVNIISHWPYQEEIVIGDNYDDHVNNFNAGNNTTEMVSEKTGKKFKGVTLMKNTNSNVFGFKSSEDNGHVFYNFRMEKINGNYYVGFDFEANGNNPNEKVDRDYIYNDWIVKIVPGKGVTPPEPDVERVRIMCEDLGASNSDFDYNDIVFDIKFIKEGTTYTADILIQAAGGTLPLTIGGAEVHNLFAVANNNPNISTTTMINTHANFGDHIDGLEPVPHTVVLPKSNYATAWDAINDLPIIVQNPNGQTVYLTITPGSPAEMIAVPNTTAWPDERVSIQYNYPAFATWISNPEIKWWITE